eukprot:gene114-biopygen8877
MLGGSGGGGSCVAKPHTTSPPLPPSISPLHLEWVEGKCQKNSDILGEHLKCITDVTNELRGSGDVKPVCSIPPLHLESL